MGDLGKIRRRVTFVNMKPSQNADGSWTNTNGSIIIECWAWRSAVNSSRSYTHYAGSLNEQHVYEVWYNPLLVVDENTLLRDEDGDYNIIASRLDDKKRKFILTATKK